MTPGNLSRTSMTTKNSYKNTEIQTSQQNPQFRSLPTSLKPPGFPEKIPPYSVEQTIAPTSSEHLITMKNLILVALRTIISPQIMTASNSTPTRALTIA